MSVRCRIFAYLMLERREPERSGQRLIQWAAVCKADGVIVPWTPDAGPGVASRLAECAQAAALSCYVEQQPDARIPAVAGIDGSYVGTPSKWSLDALKRLGPALICVEDVRQTEPYRDGLPGANFLYADRGQPLGVWLTLCRAMQQAGRPLPGYLDHTPGFRRAIERTAYAPLVVKRLTLNRSRLESTSGGALIPYELGALVRVARGIQEQLAVVNGEQPLSPGHVSGGQRPMPDRGSADVAIVIRSKNEAAWVGRTLTQIARQSRQPREVILIDNESTDDTVKIVRSFQRQLPVKILTIRDREFNFSRALNLGIKQTTASWVISLSAHCVPVSAEWLAAFERETFDEELAPFLAGAYGRQEPMEGVTSDVDKRDLWTTFGAERRVQSDQDFFFHNANSMIRRQVWEGRRFDETIHGVEDRDWAKKVLAEGHAIVYAPLASVHHHHGIHQGRNEARARRVVKIIELIQQREPIEARV